MIEIQSITILISWATFRIWAGVFTCDFCSNGITCATLKNGATEWRIFTTFIRNQTVTKNWFADAVETTWNLSINQKRNSIYKSLWKWLTHYEVYWRNKLTCEICKRIQQRNDGKESHWEMHIWLQTENNRWIHYKKE